VLDCGRGLIARRLTTWRQLRLGCGQLRLGRGPLELRRRRVVDDEAELVRDLGIIDSPNL